MKTILGLDLGTNSIGWAIIDKENQKILGMNTRIIPMGVDKQDYEKGIGITKNANRREKRNVRKGNKRYKLRRNKLLFILNELDMLPEQFKFKNGIPEATKLQELELLPIPKKSKQMDALDLLELRCKALNEPVNLKEVGQILYQFNQLRGYSGGGNEENKKKKQDEEDSENKKYEIIVQKIKITEVTQSEDTFTVKGGKNKGEKLHKFDVLFELNGENKEGQTELQNLKEKIEQEEELEIRIKRTKKGENITIALPQKSNWRKTMELSEKTLKEENLFISQLRLRDLKTDKWTRIRNRVFLRNRYKEEFDKFWDTQSKAHKILGNCSKDILEKIANFIFPGTSETQQKLRKEAIEGGLKYIIKEQIIYYQRPLKPQTGFISNCRFEKTEKVIATSHPLFQEFRCWKQINNLYVTSKTLIDNKYKYENRYLTAEEKLAIYEKLQTQKEVGFGTVLEILNRDSSNEKLDREQKKYFINGLNVKAKLKGCDTLFSIKKVLGDSFDEFIKQDERFVEKIWAVIFDVTNHIGSEYDAESKRVLSIKEILLNYTNNKEKATELALKTAQNISFPRKYGSLSQKAIEKVLPLMKLDPQDISEEIKTKFKNITQLIETGEIVENINYNLEDYVIDFVKNNPNILEEGGIMESFAISLVYGKHTAETIKAQIKNYHDIKYEKRNFRNPIVEQLTNETMQVIKAIWKQFKFDPKDLEIRVELARDLKNSATEREKIWKGQRKNKTINDNVKERLRDEGINITEENILRYRLYEQQKYMSPYTKKKIIPFSKLFDDKEYDIDHIIPKSRYYDDSFSNKVICEKYINEEKSNKTAWEYISQQNSKFKNENGELEILSPSDFIFHINENFFGKKKKNLLAEKIPTNPIERQLKDTQYISIAVKNELAKIVGSENVKISTGEVTDFLRSRWGLKKLFMEMTESRFKQMELWDLDENENPKTNWVTKYFDKEKQKNIYEIKNWSKRYDHRHHAIDALVVALTEQSHIQRLNNLNKYVQEELERRKSEFKIEQKEGEPILETFFNLEEKRRDEILKEMDSSRHFEKPFSYIDKNGEIKSSLIEQVKGHLETMIVSHKVKDKISITKDEFDEYTPKKQLKNQIKIRAALHEATYYGKINNRDTKRVDLSSLKLADIPRIVIDKILAEAIIDHKKHYESMKEAFTGEGLMVFNEKRREKGYPPVYKVKVWYNKEEKTESNLQRLYDYNKKQSVITGDNYLFIVMEKETKEGKKRVFDIASLYDSVSIVRDTLKEDSIDFKKRIAEDYRISYGKSNPQAIPDRVLFTLQQNELVYLPNNDEEKEQLLKMSKDEFAEWISDKENRKNFSKRIYKVVKFTGKDCFFIPHNYANSISVTKDLSKKELNILEKKYGEKKIPKQEKNYEEFGSFGTCTKTEVNENFVKELTMKKSYLGNKPLKIQDTCIKIHIDWIGNLSID